MNENKTEKYIVNSAAAMQDVGKSLAKRLRGGDVVLLSGELGAGKTVLCKGIAAGLNIKAQVVSPTFTIMNEYVGKTKLCHFDLYRLEDADEAFGAGLTDFIGDPQCICAVEWWEKIPELFDGCNTVTVNIIKTGDEKREVIVK